jgi:hypothetical protein
MPESQDTQATGHRPQHAPYEKPHLRAFVQHPERSLAKGASCPPVAVQEHIATKEQERSGESSQAGPALIAKFFFHGNG